MIYLLGAIRKYLSFPTALRILKSMVPPYYEYIFFILKAFTDKLITKLQRLQRLQNRGVRLCLRASRETSITGLHTRARLLTVKNKIQLNTLKFMHRRIYHTPCRDIKKNAGITRSNASPLFVDIQPTISKFQKSLCDTVM